MQTITAVDVLDWNLSECQISALVLNTIIKLETNKLVVFKVCCFYYCGSMCISLVVRWSNNLDWRDIGTDSCSDTGPSSHYWFWNLLVCIQKLVNSEIIALNDGLHMNAIIKPKLHESNVKGG